MNRKDRRQQQSIRDRQKAKATSEAALASGQAEAIKRTQKPMAFATFKATWQDYRTVTMPEDAGPVQVMECRRAFYAGALAFHGLSTQQLDPGYDPTEEDLERYSRWVEELHEFGRNVGKGGL